MKIVVSGISFKNSRFFQAMVVMCAKYSRYPVTSNQTFEINVVNEKTITSLNYQFRNKQSPTDVLSFRGKDEWIGSVVLCLNKIRKQNVSFKESLYKTLIHGALHVFGYDHETDEEENKMNEIEQKVYKSYLAIK